MLGIMEMSETGQDVCLKITPGKNVVIKLPSEQGGGGVTYTRYGKTSCAGGSELVYDGIVSGTHYTQKGGGVNYLCLPKDPEYLSSSGISHPTYLYGSEYESYNKVFSNKVHDYNVPCAVCYSPRSAKLMIPGKTSCPAKWNREYYGYLMSDYYNHKSSTFECVDADPDVISGSAKNINGALFYFTTSSCSGVPCSPYQKGKAVTCVVCTK